MFGRPAGTYIQQLCVDTGYSTKDLPAAMDDRDRLRERVRKICVSARHDDDDDDDDDNMNIMTN